MNAAAANARRLAEDAKLLLDGGRFPTAISLALLAIEEAAKPSIIREILVAQDEKPLKTAWQRYRRHTDKNYIALMTQLVSPGARQLHQFRSLFLKESEPDRQIVDSIKQVGFYTDCYRETHWSIPAEVMSEDFARSTVTTADALTGHREPVAEREIELCGGLTHRNLMAWCDAVVAEGIKPPEYVLEMRRFARGMPR